MKLGKMLVEGTGLRVIYRVKIRRTAEPEPAILSELKPILSNRLRSPAPNFKSGSKVKALCFLFKNMFFYDKEHVF